ncbi:hypothetical protein DDZ14_17525 [Maritimibacter sp. 55A14]|uniref:NYN domain-containing protein n=1 Tax=Maritimibacter sp. 55A14 TaxID=2174844 RepID=UPI000D61CB77|nr:NYN domain-containing protein [Maritimibacter sp. 55A14]PWE29307.1 hypothetical protein DDZ14_17525 [Maritimibacter sp. 55A14]
MKDLSPADFATAVTPAAPRWALLVDGENVAPVHADRIMRHVAELGKATVRRVYCDPSIQRDWDDDPRLSTVYPGSARTKNAADIRLVIDAMDLAYSRAVEGFVIVSKDGDFAPLATRLCDMGFSVLGIGPAPSSTALRHACSAFLTLTEDSPPPRPAPSPAAPPAPQLTKLESVLVDLIEERGDKGCLPIVSVNGLVRGKMPAFKIGDTPEKTWRAYLVARPNLFECQQRGPDACVRLARR